MLIEKVLAIPLQIKTSGSTLFFQMQTIYYPLLTIETSKLYAFNL